MSVSLRLITFAVAVAAVFVVAWLVGSALEVDPPGTDSSSGQSHTGMSHDGGRT